MSWLSKATGIHLGNIGAPIGALVGSVVPGVGTALGAGLGQALGGVGSGHGVGQSALEGVGAYAGSKALGSLANAMQNPTGVPFGQQQAGGMSSGGNTVTDANGNPVSDPNAGQTGGGGTMDWIQNFLKSNGISGGDLLKTGGAVASGVANYAGQQAQLNQQRDQFNKNYGLAQNQQGMQASRALNAAPILDKGQYLAQNFAAPTAFQPRDITRGIGQFQNPGQQGGAAAQLAANSAASANYKQGDGGYDTSTLKTILSRVQGAG